MHNTSGTFNETLTMQTSAGVQGLFTAKPSKTIAASDTCTHTKTHSATHRTFEDFPLQTATSSNPLKHNTDSPHTLKLVT